MRTLVHSTDKRGKYYVAFIFTGVRVSGREIQARLLCKRETPLDLSNQALDLIDYSSFDYHLLFIFLKFPFWLLWHRLCGLDWIGGGCGCDGIWLCLLFFGACLIYVVIEIEVSPI